MMRSYRWRVRAGLAITCSAALILSWGNTGGISRAEGPMTAPRPSAPAVAATVLVDFSDPAAVAAWTTVNDPVMGGRSTSAVTFGEGGLVFSGTISLENNGGFASARGPFDPEIGNRAAGATALRLRAQADGRTYLLKLETGQPWSYVQRFATEAGTRRTYDLPVAGFEPVGRFLEPLPIAPPLDPSVTSRIGIYILDKQEGPFRLVATAIEAGA